MSDIAWAIAQFRDDRKLDRYKNARRYYFGDHDCAFNRQRMWSIFRGLFVDVKDNLMPAVVDSMTDRLNLTGFQSTESQEPNEVTQEAWRIWQRNQMDVRAQEVHREALLTGDGYVMVWPDATGKATIYPHLAHEMTVLYDPERPGVILQAAKLWISDVDRRVRLNIYFPDRIERHQSMQPLQSYTTGMSQLSERDFEPVPALEQAGFDETATVAAVVPNPYGRVPVFHFPNKRYLSFGVSELHDVLPIQDALNKAITDMLVAMEFSSFRQRWVTGLDVGELDETTGKPKHPPFDYGADKMLAASDPATQFGEFGTTDLSQFLQVQENLRSEIARVSGTPLHYLFITRGDYPSGEAMKSAEARFTKKIVDRQVAFGNVWEDALAFCLKIDDVPAAEGYRLSAVWETATPRSEREIAETMLMKLALGVSKRQLLRELGYDAELIDEMLAEAAEQAAVLEDQSVAAANGRITLPGQGNRPVNVPGANPVLPLPGAPPR